MAGNRRNSGFRLSVAVIDSPRLALGIDNDLDRRDEFLSQRGVGLFDLRLNFPFEAPNWPMQALKCPPSNDADVGSGSAE
jgi:hypothetical protein